MLLCTNLDRIDNLFFLVSKVHFCCCRVPHVIFLTKSPFDSSQTCSPSSHCIFFKSFPTVLTFRSIFLFSQQSKTYNLLNTTGQPPPQPSRTNRPSYTSQSNVPQNPNSPQPTQGSQQQSGGFWGNVSKGFSSMMGSNSNSNTGVPQSQFSAEKRNELLSGATLSTNPQTFNPHDPRFNQTQGNSDAQQEYYLKLAQQVDSSALDQALQNARNCENIGMATLEELGSQADGLDRIDRNIESVHLQLDRGNRQISAIGITGAAKNVVRGDTAHKQNRAVYNAYNNNVSHQVEVDDSFAKKYNTQATNQRGGGSGSSALKDKLAEQDRQLDELSSTLANLQNIGGTIGKETQRQNTQLDKINHRTEQAIHRTHDASYKMQRLM